jgi:hypothetical protein
MPGVFECFLATIAGVGGITFWQYEELPNFSKRCFTALLLRNGLSSMSSCLICCKISSIPMLHSSTLPQKTWKCKLPKRTLFAALLQGWSLFMVFILDSLYKLTSRHALSLLMWTVEHCAGNFPFILAVMSRIILRTAKRGGNMLHMRLTALRHRRALIPLLLFPA